LVKGVAMKALLGVPSTSSLVFCWNWRQPVTLVILPLPKPTLTFVSAVTLFQLAWL
jgi:hypothetical protein